MIWWRIPASTSKGFAKLQSSPRLKQVLARWSSPISTSPRADRALETPSSCFQPTQLQGEQRCLSSSRLAGNGTVRLVIGTIRPIGRGKNADFIFILKKDVDRATFSKHYTRC